MVGSAVSPMFGSADVAVDGEEGDGGGRWKDGAAAVEDWEWWEEEDRRLFDTRLSRSVSPRDGGPRLRRS
jgi:hypothetical protein